MAIYLPVVAVLLAGGGPERMALSVSVAIATVVLVLFVAVRFGRPLSRFVAHESDEIILLTTFGTVLLVAGVAQRLQVSAAIGAFLVGIAVSGPMAEQSHRLLSPLRDLFAATFFFFFGLQIDPATLPPSLLFAAGLGIVTAGTKVLTGYWASRDWDSLQPLPPISSVSPTTAKPSATPPSAQAMTQRDPRSARCLQLPLALGLRCCSTASSAAGRSCA